MKRTIQILAASAFIFVAAFSNSAKAQSNEKDLVTLAKKYEDAYNKKDAKAIKAFYTKDAVRVSADGTTTNGSEAIGADAANFFANNGAADIKITTNKTVTESNGTVTATGTYEGTVGGNSYSGNFTNTCVKEKGHWKISKSVLSN
ncbi:MAG: nuclear transport factor 2 family protein [Parafilimonas sp.]